MDQELRQRIESLLQLELADTIGISDLVEANHLIDRFVAAVASRPEQNLERWLVPQWVVLAAGLGTRIDSTGRINKNLDVWFGGYNTLQLARRYLPGNLPHIVVLHPTLIERLHIPGTNEIDPERSDVLLGPDAQIVVQPQPDGPGGALRAALPLLEQSQAEFIGVAYGDEPFLDSALFVQTLLSHFVANADVSLCGKIPETVVDKGGLFFDADGRFQGTKEWREMSTQEQQWMWKRLNEGCAYTNTGITLIRREAALERLSQLMPHGSKGEYHHVDLIRHCYEDGLKTNAHIYRSEITSGVNRWNNVLVGQQRLEERQRDQLARQGVRILPESRIHLGEGRYSLQPKVTLGRCVQLGGDIFLGHGVSIGDYSVLEDVSLSANTYVGSSSRLTQVVAEGCHVEDGPVPQAAGAPVKGLRTTTSLERCQLERVWVGASSNLVEAEAHHTLIPSGTQLSGVHLGLFQRTLKRCPWLPPDYLPGEPIGQDTSALDRLKTQILTEWIPAATQDPSLRESCADWVARYLDGIVAGEAWAPEEITAQQIAGNVCEICRMITHATNPLWHVEALPQQSDEPQGLPTNLSLALRPTPMRILWLHGDKRDLPEEMGIIAQLLGQHHRVTLAAKSVGVLWDTVLQDVEPYRAQLGTGAWRLIDTGSNCLGVDLRQTTGEFWNALANADLVVTCGSNASTTRKLQHPSVLRLS